MAAAPAHVFFDVYLSGVARLELDRAQLVRLVEARFRIVRVEAAAFIASGQRIRVHRGVDEETAMKALAALQSLGAAVELEPNRPPADALEPFADVTPFEPGAAALLDESLAPVEESKIDREAPTAGGPIERGAVSSEVVTNPLYEKREEASLEIPIVVELPPAAREAAEYHPEPPPPRARPVRPVALWLLAASALAAGLYWLR